MCKICAKKHLVCGFLIPNQTLVKSVTSQVNYLEIMQALLKHTIGDEPPETITDLIGDCKNTLHAL